MIDDIKKNYGLVRVLLLLSIIAVGSYVVSLAWTLLISIADLFIVLLISWLLSFVLEPVVDSMQKWFKFSKIFSALATYLMLSLLLVATGIICIPLITAQIPNLLTIIPEYLNSAPKFMADFNSSLLSQLGNSVNLIPSIAQFLFSAFTVLILSFYLVIDHDKFNEEVFNLVPEDWKESYKFSEKVINDTFVSFLRVQFFYAIVAGVTTWIIFTILGIDFGVSVAFISGLFTLIPLVGPVIAMILAVLVSLSVGSFQAIVVAIYLFIIQQITYNVIGPKILGKAMKIHPGVVLFSFVVGLKFGGAMGAFFAIPVLGISILMIKRFGHRVLSLKEMTNKNN